MKKLLSLAVLMLCAAAQVQAGVIFFSNDLAGFTAAMTADGNTLLGTETFEESTQAPASSTGMNDPLTQGVANGPYPAGLLQPMTVQSNLSAGAAVAPNPRGSEGLVAVSAGAFGATSDVVVARTFVDSLDWIFSPATQLAGLGFNPVDLAFGSGTLEIEVYSIGNVLLGTTTIPVDAAGTNFLGIEATGGDRIGRVNFFSPGSRGGAEGGDNAMLFQPSQQAPEPGTLLLLALAGASMGLMRRYRRQ